MNVANLMMVGKFHGKKKYEAEWNFLRQCMKTKELGWKETQGIQNIGIEHSQGNRIVEQSQVLKIWENYITELHDRPNRPVTPRSRT